MHARALSYSAIAMTFETTELLRPAAELNDATVPLIDLPAG